MTTTDSYTAAYNAAAAYAQEETDGMLAALRDALRDNPEMGTDDLYDALHEMVDGCQVCIYTGRAWAYCFGSSNDGAAEDETGETPKTIEQRAYWALLVDVRETTEYAEMLEAIEEGTVADYLAAEPTP